MYIFSNPEGKVFRRNMDIRSIYNHKYDKHTPQGRLLYTLTMWCDFDGYEFVLRHDLNSFKEVWLQCNKNGDSYMSAKWLSTWQNQSSESTSMFDYQIRAIVEKCILYAIPHVKKKHSNDMDKYLKMYHDRQLGWDEILVMCVGYSSRKVNVAMNDIIHDQIPKSIISDPVLKPVYMEYRNLNKYTTSHSCNYKTCYRVT